MPDFSEYIRLDAQINQATNKALLVYFPDLGEEYWIPLSQVDDRSEIWKVGESGQIWISEWIAKQKGIA